MTGQVDLIVVGTGAAAQSVAFPCRAAGWSVVVVDSDPFGGTCQLRGCDPKKVLVGVAELIDWGRRMQGNGPSGPAPALDWPDMIRFKRTFTGGAPAAVDQGFKDAGRRSLLAAGNGQVRSACGGPVISLCGPAGPTCDPGSCDKGSGPTPA
jgi:glutathione reductase (NADPH)